MTEIGRIEKPRADQYRNMKKIYFVRNLYLPKNATDRYREIYVRYWSEVDDHLKRLEAAGAVSKIFCESIYMSGDEAMKVLSAMNARLEKIVREKVDAGAALLPLEDKEIFGAYVDWSNCLMIVRTEEVHKKIHEFLHEALNRRYEHIRTVLADAIAVGEAALLIMREEDQKSLGLPPDIELFTISPPAYEDLLGFIRDRDSGKEYWRT